MMKHAAFISLVALMATPVSAKSFKAVNRVKVTPVAGGFSVPSGGEQGARGMWCAASDYARRAVGASGTSRLYVAQPQARGSSRAPVVFSLSASGLTPKRVRIVGSSIRQAGASLSVNHAYAFCADRTLGNG